MKLLTYIWRNVRRNKLRSLLTILSVGFSLALMTILYGYLAMQDVSAAEAEKHDRLVVLNKLGFAAPLPIAHVDKISKMDGVVAASPFSWFGGKYKSKENQFACFAVEPETMFDIFSEYDIPEDQVAEFKKDRQGCVADQRLAEQMEWKLGERIPIEGTIYQYDLDLRLVGIFSAASNTGSLMFNWNYLDEELKAGGAVFSGNAGSIQAKCVPGSDVAAICEDIDLKFANSENSTRSRTEAAFQKMFADMLGDVQTYIRFISLAVVFALSLVAATAMAMSMRERTTEIAVLKAIGFSKQRVLALVLGESTMIAVIGGIVGICGGLGALQLLSSVPVAASLFPVPVSSLVGPWLGGLAAVAAGIGFVSGVVPAILASRLSVIDGLRQVV
jgi:putative ABC transport system permease protein